MIARYVYGWWIFARALWIVRRKRHGAGAQPWRYAFATASCERWLVDGQHRGQRRLWWLPRQS